MLSISISSLCCYGVPAFEQHPPSVEKPGDDSSHHSQKRIDHAPGPVYIETEPSLISADTEPLHCPHRIARKSGMDLGMVTGRDRLHGDTRRLAGSALDITRQTLPGTCTSKAHHYSAHDDEQNIVSDSSAFYLAPLISVSSIGTEVQATSPPEVPEAHDGDLIQSPGLIGTIAPCPVTEEPACIDCAAADDASVHKSSPVECDAKSIATTTPEIIITPSKLEPIISDEDPWSPFGTWLLAQTLDARGSPSLGAGAGATPNADTIPVNGFHHRMQSLEGDLLSLGSSQAAAEITNAYTQIPNRHDSTWTARSARQRPHCYPTDGAEYPSGAGKSCCSKDSSYLTVPETTFGPGRLGRRGAYVSLSSCKLLPHVSGNVRLTVAKGMMTNDPAESIEARTEARTRHPWI